MITYTSQARGGIKRKVTKVRPRANFKFRLLSYLFLVMTLVNCVITQFPESLMILIDDEREKTIEAIQGNFLDLNSVLSYILIQAKST